MLLSNPPKKKSPDLEPVQIRAFRTASYIPAM